MTSFRDFKGAARPLDDIDIPRLGFRLGVGEDEIHAVMDVEAAGGAWDKQGRPKMLFEPHRFYKNLGPGAARDLAVREGLAYPKWGEKPYPADSYPRLIRAMAIDEAAALKSASWGLGQILGENFAMLGYESPQAMVLAFLDDADVHLEGMVAFILAAGLDDELRAHNWSAFARGYNGPQYAKHKYHERLEARFKWWQGKPDTAWSPPVPTPRPEIIVQPEPVVLAPAPIGHNGGPALDPEPRSANPSPTPVEQSSKAVGAGKWAAILGALWTVVVASDVLPAQFTTPAFTAAVTALLAAAGGVIGAYIAPANAVPGKTT